MNSALTLIPAFVMVFVPLIIQPVVAQFEPNLFERDNLVAWCIVPFDSQKRTPDQRADMLVELGIKKLAYDYRAEHIPTFDAEIDALNKRGIELTAWWFPTILNDEAKGILKLFKKHKIAPQVWVMGGGDPNMSPTEESKFIDEEVKRIGEIANAANAVGCKVALYNHGGWFGNPLNQVKIIKRLGLENVGIVYNLHHAHDQIDNLSAILSEIQPYLLAINLNGTQTNGEALGKKILPIGQGDRDLEIIRIIGESGYRGPIGILNHTDEDAKLRLQANFAGLTSIVNSLEKK